MKRKSINERTGTTLEERQRIRRRHKSEKIRAARGIHSGATSDAYRDGYDAVFRKKKTITCVDLKYVTVPVNTDEFIRRCESKIYESMAIPADILRASAEQDDDPRYDCLDDDHCYECLECCDGCDFEEES